MGRRPRLWLGSLCTCTTALVYNHSTSHKVELLVLCILSPFEGGNEGDETAAWYEEDASWASAGTAPPVNPAQAEENTITGGACICTNSF
uniref:Secreted protein n=1 Tax=Rhizophora mucronata TaxID=61149 RepID=A0A2P2KGG8_RHIMU